MTSPASSLNSQIPMEHQKHKLVLDEEEEEEVPSLQSRQSQLHSSNNSNSNSNNSTASDTTTLLVNISSTNGNGNGNGKGNENGSLIRSSSSSSSSSSSNSSINDDSETPKIGVSSPCGSPHKPSVDEQRAHNLNSVYFDQHHGPNSIDGVSDVNCSGVTCSVFETSPGDVEVLVKNSEIQKSLIKDVNLQLRENSDNEGLSGSSLTPLKDTFEERNFKSKSSGSETRVAGELDLIEEIDQEVTELDIEKVLEKQNTHDLYCPNCNSCITRKVILRRRTRKIRKACRKPKHAKADAILPSELDANFIYSDANSADSADGPGHDTANICSNDCPTPAVDDNNCDVFRCLSCFSFFIPAGNGFKLFRVSSTENENVQDSQKSTANTNWFFSIFGTHKRKTTTEQGNAAVDPAQVDGTNQDTTPSFSNNVTSSNGSDRSVMPHADRTMVNTREHPDGSDSKPHQSGTESLNPSLMEPLLLNNKSPGVDIRSNFEDKAINALENKNIGNDVIVTIEKEPLSHVGSEIVCIDSVETTSLLNSANQTNMGEQRVAGVRESLQWEILKSIVYGGLIESITSLGVVSSSAGAGAATSNIIAIGLANLIGGLFIIGNNLMDLKNLGSNEVNEQEDRYQKTLGRRDNFSLHATVSVLSFLIFGLLPPVIYGFSFRKSDDRDLKLAAVGGASLICIILLAIGKAHVQSKPYFSTVFYFFSTGVIASGASYIAGDLISKLLQKISGFESSLSFPDLKPTEPAAWAIYRSVEI